MLNMYLNIINNIKSNDKRNNKNFHVSEKKENKTIDLEKEKFFEDNTLNSYHSIFYGDLTKTWLNLNNK